MDRYQLADDPAYRQQYKEVLLGIKKVCAEVNSEGELITYVDLGLRLNLMQPHIRGLEEMHTRPPFRLLIPALGVVCTDEHRARRGLITACVVTQEEPHEPGPGFYAQARALGYNIPDEKGFWQEQLTIVRAVWQILPLLK